jgi:group II intron reverse transcriptase/maturase
VEEREGRVTELLEGHMAGTSSPSTISTKLQRIAKLAKEGPQMAFTTLAHHIDVEWLQEAYRRSRKDGAVGVDGQTAEAYEENLEENLQMLLNHAKAGTYHAPPVRRVNIPKGEGKATRPIGIPTFEDKVLQRAVVMALEPIYEQDFLPCSYGFRPERDAHQALSELWDQVMRMEECWIADVDIRAFFDTMDKGQLRQFLAKRVRDGVLLRLIGKWLNAGVMEGGEVHYPEAGTPQGGVVSPLLSNIYLHEVLDVWFERDVKPRLRGRAFLIRYCDDFVLGFSCEEDARRVMEVLPKRFGKYGLTLHPEKTRLVAFTRPPRGPAQQGANPKVESFDLLGFTHYWGRSRQGRWVVKRKTACNRVSRAFRRVTDWCRRHRHRPIREQWETLKKKLSGHYQYYGITGNWQGLARFQEGVKRIWHKWLNRRSRQRTLTWERFKQVLTWLPLPVPVVAHSVYRLAAKP